MDIDRTKSLWVAEQQELFSKVPLTVSMPSGSHRVPEFPFKRPSFDEAMESFIDLKRCAISVSSGEWFSRSNISGEEFIPTSMEGLKASGHYSWQARMACDSTNSPSPIRKWFIPKFREGVESSKYYADSPRTALALRGYSVSQFRPSAALAIMRKFNASSWYDPCGGWGDRMVAAQASGIEYYCRDVNPLALAGYAAQATDFGGNVSFELKGAEVDCPQRDYFDLCFTSPPYWKAERYQGAEQSWVKFKQLGEWLDGFLNPMLSNGWDSVRRGGVLAINISNVYLNHRVNDLCTPVVEFFNERNVSANFLGYRMAKRPASSAKSSGVFCEPIIWGVKK